MTNYDYLPPIPVSYGLSIIFFSVSIFSLINYQIKKITKSVSTYHDHKSNNEYSELVNSTSNEFKKSNPSSNYDVPSDVKRRCHKEVSQDDDRELVHKTFERNTIHPQKTVISMCDSDATWKWRNLFVSWLHALIVAIWDLTCFHYYPELMSDLVSYNNLYIYGLVAFSTGYFLYDLLVIVFEGRIHKMWEVVPHHIAVTAAFAYNVFSSFSISYCVVALLTEVNTVFLHSRKLLQMHGFGFSHWLYRLNSFFNFFTFITCRFGALVWIVCGLYNDRLRLHVAYHCCMALSLATMAVTNTLLFCRIFKNDVLRGFFEASGGVKGGVSDVKGGVGGVKTGVKDSGGEGVLKVGSDGGVKKDNGGGDGGMKCGDGDGGVMKDAQEKGDKALLKHRVAKADGIGNGKLCM